MTEWHKLTMVIVTVAGGPLVLDSSSDPLRFTAVNKPPPELARCVKVTTPLPVPRSLPGPLVLENAPEPPLGAVGCDPLVVVLPPCVIVVGLPFASVVAMSVK